MLLAVLAGTPVRAPAEVAAPGAQDPFVVLVPVEDRTPGARARALRRAVAEGLSRAAGLEEGPDDGSWALAAPRAFVLREGYERMEPVAGRVVGEPDSELALRVVLDADALERHLRERGLPFWGRERPELLLWLMATEPGRPDGPRRTAAPSVVENDPRSPVARFATAALRRARQRGQPVLLPVLDLDEQRRIRPLALWSGFLDDAEDAARAYAVDGVLWARLVEATAGYEVSFRLRTGALDEALVFDCASPERCGARVADALANRLAARLAVRTDAAVEPVYVQLIGVTDFPALQRVRGAFGDLGMVRTARLRELKGDALLFELAVQGSATQLLDALALVDAVELEPAARSVQGPALLRGRYRGPGRGLPAPPEGGFPDAAAGAAAGAAADPGPGAGSGQGAP